MSLPFFRLHFLYESFRLWLDSLFRAPIGYGELVWYQSGTGKDLPARVTDVDGTRIRIRVLGPNPNLQIWVSRACLKKRMN